MPLYEYECKACGRRTEVIQRFDDAPLGACPECGGEVVRLLSAPAVQFKGTGWYVTDYGGKSGASKSEGDGSAKAETGSTPSSDGSGEGKKTAEKAAKSAASE